MLRFSFIPQIGVSNDYASFERSDNIDYETRFVDESFFVSNTTADKILAKQIAGQVLDSIYFDGEENIRAGSVNVYARQKCRDLAELTQQQRALQASVEKEVSSQLKSMSRKRNAEANATASQPVSEASPATPSASS